MINLLKMINNNTVLESILRKRIIDKEERKKGDTVYSVGCI